MKPKQINLYLGPGRGLLSGYESLWLWTDSMLQGQSQAWGGRRFCRVLVVWFLKKTSLKGHSVLVDYEVALCRGRH